MKICTCFPTRLWVVLLIFAGKIRNFLIADNEFKTSIGITFGKFCWSRRCSFNLQNSTITFDVAIKRPTSELFLVFCSIYIVNVKWTLIKSQIPKWKALFEWMIPVVANN